MNKIIIAALLFNFNLYAQNFNSISFEKDYKSIQVKKWQLKKTLKDSIIEKSEKEIAKKENIPITEKNIFPYNDLSLPLEKLVITSNYGMRFHPIKKEWKFHNGVDFKTKNDTIKSLLNGVVENSGYDENLGYFVKIRHNDYVVTYGHLNQYFLLKDTYIKSGTALGVTGNTGLSTGYHLHLSVSYKEQSINPLLFLNELILINQKLQKFKKT